MIIWIDAQLSPEIASWINENFSCQAFALGELGLRDAKDREIFLAAKEESAIVMTKDSDFLKLIDEIGPPPQVIWLTCGNTSNEHLKQILTATLHQAFELLEAEEGIVEITG